MWRPVETNRVAESAQARLLDQVVAPGLVFLVALLPRVIYPVSRPMQWYSRAIRFGDALLAQNWAETYQRYHPGVTVMWLSGMGLKLFAWWRGLSSDHLLGAAPTRPGTMDDAITAAVVPLAFVCALCIALAYTLLSRIVRRKVAFASSLLLALDPFCITYSKVLHPDGLLAVFMLVSVLFLLNYLHRARRFDLILSGVFAGLAFLSKGSSLFLLPYAALAVGSHKLTGLRSSAKLQESTLDGRRRWVDGLLEVIRVLLTWGVAACAVFVALWPAMWVEPLEVLRKIGQNLLYHVETTHWNPTFFNGHITLEDPGIAFYLATFAWKTTAITLPMFCASVLQTLPRSRRNKQSILVQALVSYIVFFTAQMAVGGWKQMSYILPAFPALDIVAGFGLVHSAEAIGRTRWCRRWRRLPTVFTMLVLALQAGIVLPRHPYYGTHHNILLGGSRVAQHILPLQDQGEGLDLAAQYLNTLPRAQRASAVLHRRSAEIFRRNFVGLTSIANDPRANYRIYYVNQVMRRLGSEEWEETWNADRQTEPLWSVAFDGVTYVWVYGSPPQEPAPGGPEIEVSYRLGEHIELKQVRLSAWTLAPGDTLTVVPLWTSDGELEKNYKVFCHLLSTSGELVAQRDGVPLQGVRPTPSWRDGEAIEDSYDIVLDADLAPGKYELSIGMYDADTMQRLAAYDAAGERLPGDRIVLGSLDLDE